MKIVEQSMAKENPLTVHMLMVYRIFI